MATKKRFPSDIDFNDRTQIGCPKTRNPIHVARPRDNCGSLNRLHRKNPAQNLRLSCARLVDALSDRHDNAARISILLLIKILRRVNSTHALTAISVTLPKSKHGLNALNNQLQ
jgi:hypothetical protein